MIGKKLNPLPLNSTASCLHVDFCQFYWAASQGGELGDSGSARGKGKTPSTPGEEYYDTNMKRQLLSLDNYLCTTYKATTKYTLLPMKQKQENALQRY